MPAGATPVSDWEKCNSDPILWRLIEGPRRTITDSNIDVRVFTTHLADGTFDNGDVLGEGPDIHIAGYVTNSDQARERAAALLEAAAEADA
ncbi:hypothetical protein ACAG24_026610 [Mycobacterium sp. pW049]|uniref:hypothetical protein n=1 Tax=[Mycobacterium] bulgaricum TaxID=3238985 RepID=UPI00351BCF82